MKKAIVTGISGQDGSLLAELLLTKGYIVIGATRDVENAKKILSEKTIKGIQLVKLDITDQSNINGVLEEFRPDEIYNFAAFSSGSRMFEKPIEIANVNGLAVGRILKAINDLDSGIKFCQASSSEMFGKVTESPQSENTAFMPRNPYGAAKLYAHSMTRIYREHYGIFGCSAILFNHESPRRGMDFVTKRITYNVAKIKLGLVNHLNLGNLDARRDWGFAGDYVRSMWMMLQQANPDDFVIATGESHSVRELCEIAFSHVGLDYRNYVYEDVGLYRPAEETQLIGDITKAKQLLEWEPQVSFDDLICMMVDSDLREIIKGSRDD